MYKILIFGLGADYDKYLNCIKLQEVLGKVKVVGVTRSGYEYTYVDGYPFIARNQVSAENFDVCVIGVEREKPAYKEIKKECENIGFTSDRIIPISAFAIPGFDMEKYLEIQNISIFALNCWGGGGRIMDYVWNF